MEQATKGKMMDSELHDSWLSYWRITSKRLPEAVRPMLEKHIQGAFYAGAFTVVKCQGATKEQLWRMCESGIADACGRPGMRLVDDEGLTFSEKERRRNGEGAKP